MNPNAFNFLLQAACTIAKVATADKEYEIKPDSELFSILQGSDFFPGASKKKERARRELTRRGYSVADIREVLSQIGRY